MSGVLIGNAAPGGLEGETCSQVLPCAATFFCDLFQGVQGACLPCGGAADNPCFAGCASCGLSSAAGLSNCIAACETPPAPPSAPPFAPPSAEPEAVFTVTTTAIATSVAASVTTSVAATIASTVVASGGAAIAAGGATSATGSAMSLASSSGAASGLSSSILLLGQARFIALTTMLDTGDTPLPQSYTDIAIRYSWAGLQFPGIFGPVPPVGVPGNGTGNGTGSGLSGRRLLSQEASSFLASSSEICSSAAPALNASGRASTACGVVTYLTNLGSGVTAQRLFLSSVVTQAIAAAAILLLHGLLLTVLARIRPSLSALSSLAFPRFEVAQLIAMFESICLTAFVAIQARDADGPVRVLAVLWLLSIHAVLLWTVRALWRHRRAGAVVFARATTDDVASPRWKRHGSCPLFLRTSCHALIRPWQVLVVASCPRLLRCVARRLGWRSALRLTDDDVSHRLLVKGAWEVAGKGDALSRRRAARFLGGYGELFAAFDGDNSYFYVWTLGWQCARAAVLCFVTHGAVQMGLVTGLAAASLLVTLLRAPHAERLCNYQMALGGLTEVYSLTHLTLAAHAPWFTETVDVAAAVVLGVNQGVLLLLSAASLYVSLRRALGIMSVTRSGKKAADGEGTGGGPAGVAVDAAPADVTGAGRAVEGGGVEAAPAGTTAGEGGAEAAPAAAAGEVAVATPAEVGAGAAGAAEPTRPRVDTYQGAARRQARRLLSNAAAAVVAGMGAQQDRRPLAPELLTVQAFQQAAQQKRSSVSAKV